MFGVSSGTYYQRATYGRSNKRARADTELLRLIHEIVVKHHRQSAGAPGLR